MARYVKHVAPGSFAAKLRELQLERSLTNDVLARRSGISVRLIAKYRSGESEPRNYLGEPTLNGLALANALGVGVEDLLPPEPERVAA